MSSSQYVNEFPGLDFDFLRYIDVLPENQRRIQRAYLPYFAGCRNIVDLGCGDADFVELCQAEGLNVVGVDSDEKSFASASARNLPIIQQDVFSYLAAQPANSVDGIFCAHLVEHLPYPKVIELVHQSYRLLQPGGILVLLTPNVRSLFAHLEMFYLHFGHVSFYHPRLLAFFLEHDGFTAIEIGENEETASPLLPFVKQMAADSTEFTVGAVLPPAWVEPPPASAGGRSVIAYRREIPRQGSGPLAAASYRAKRWLTRWLVQPAVDALAQGVEDELNGANSALRTRLAEQQARLDALAHAFDVGQRQIYYLEQEARRLRRDLGATAESIQSVNRPFETFVVGRKPK